MTLFLLNGKIMPRVFEWNGYKFFFFSNEGIPLEPCHIHVRKGGNIAKYWIIPHVLLDSSWGMSPKELNDIEKKVLENRDLILEKWNEFFNR
ncbi:MAG TPA: DUF4160 domain-containing protein [Spirochaetota bacterium]|nr:DUF4160 domain-containing protein [Spirochaetota bacterium]